MLAALRDRPQVSDQFAANVVWMSHDKLLPGRSYLMKINHTTVAATVTDIHHRLDINTLSKLAAKTLELNEIGSLQLVRCQTACRSILTPRTATPAHSF